MVYGNPLRSSPGFWIFYDGKNTIIYVLYNEKIIFVREKSGNPGISSKTIWESRVRRTYSTVQYCTVLCSTVQYCTVLYNTVQLKVRLKVKVKVRLRVWLKVMDEGPVEGPVKGPVEGPVERKVILASWGLLSWTLAFGIFWAGLRTVFLKNNRGTQID